MLTYHSPMLTYQTKPISGSALFRVFYFGTDLFLEVFYSGQ